MSLLLFLLIPILLVIFWRFNRYAPLDRGLDPVDPKGSDLVAMQIAAAERLREEAASTKDPDERALLIKLADEADADAKKIKQELD